MTGCFFREKEGGEGRKEKGLLIDRWIEPRPTDTLARKRTLPDVLSFSVCFNVFRFFSFLVSAFLRPRLYFPSNTRLVSILPPPPSTIFLPNIFLILFVSARSKSVVFSLFSDDEEEKDLGNIDLFSGV